MKKIIQVIALSLLPCWGFAGLSGCDDTTSKSYDKIAEAARLFFATKNPNINNLISPWSKNITTELYTLTNDTGTQKNSNKKITPSKNQTNSINTDISSINKNHDEFNTNILDHNTALMENDTLNQPQEVFSIVSQVSFDPCVTSDFSSDYKMYSYLEFHGFWKKEFTLIKDYEFTLGTGEKITTPFMSVNISGCLSYTCPFTDWTIVRIPYKNEYVMDIILPVASTLTNEEQCQAMFTLLAALNGTNKNRKIKKTKTIISMPLFKFKQKKLFTDAVNLYKQECFIHVDKKGTKAKPSSNLAFLRNKVSNFMQPYDNIVVDRPFFFAVSKIKYHNNKPLIDDIILLGKIENPQ